ncbi:MAG TPA: ABC-type transport auxiliary lipoprotein family protein [Pseudoduganella sp.]
MKKNILLTAVVAAAALAGCASKGPQPTSYDFGPMGAPLPAASLAPAAVGTKGTDGTNGTGVPATGITALVVSDVSGPASLDTQRMFYRLMYADARQSRPYAYNNWSVTPLQLLSQRLKARIAQSGVKVVSTSDAAGGLPLLRLEADEFSQNFDTATQSSASITLRASVFRNHKLVDQRTFSRTARAPSADAAGGASALAESTDGIAADILAWLATLPK